MKTFKHFILALLSSCLLLSSCGSTGIVTQPHREMAVQVDDDDPDNDEVPEPIHFVYKDDHGADDDEYLFYSDDFFRHRGTRYNEHLASLSVHMTKYSQNPGNPDSTGDSDWYAGQSRRIHAFFDAIGFYHFDANTDYYTRTAFDTIGIALTSKVVTQGDNQFTVIAKSLSQTISLEAKDYLMNIQDCQGVGVDTNIALAAFISYCSAALDRSTNAQLAVLGSMTIGGTISKVENLADVLQVCFDAGAKKILLPMTSAMDIGTVPSELFSKFTTTFYTSPEDAVIKALGIE